LERSNLFFLIAVIVGVGVTYVAVDQAYSTGRAVSSATCVDSDKGLDYYTAGYVTYRNKNSYDYCSGNKVVEWYCPTKTRRASKIYNCPDGCAKGKCGGSLCTDECAYANQKECLPVGSAVAYRTCGNYDTDSCLEWSNPNYCPATYTCSGGNCIPGTCTPASCSSLSKQCGTWPDRCGSTITCGTCPTDQQCDNNGMCVTPGACSNDCSPVGARRCSGTTSYQVCGNYDTDSCLEWGNMTSCTYGQTCKDGMCSNIPCSNECSVKGKVECYGNYCKAGSYNVNCKTYRVCDNYDADSCLEWSALKTCEGSCYNNKCIGI